MPFNRKAKLKKGMHFHRSLFVEVLPFIEDICR
jgi:hypothetical protein